MKPQSLRFGTQAALCVDAVPRRDHGSRTSGQGVSGSSRGLLLASGAAGLVAIAASGTRARRRESACDAAPLPLAGETVDTDTDHLVKPSCGGPASLQERPWPGIGWVALRLCRHMIVFVPLALLYLPSRVAGAGARDLWWRALLFALESSGPALVKLGQWAATRSDIFPVELCRRLSQLHSGARTHLLALSAPGLQELLDDANYTLVSIDDEPIGSGCIAQVHRAAVAHNSSPDVLDVAIKLIHPGVVTGALADIEVMRFVARVLELVPAVRYLSLRESVEEFAGLLQVQLDLRHEAANLERFARNFHDNTHVSFPRPIRPLVSSSVLCETLQEGTPLSEWISGARRVEFTTAQRMEVARIGVNAFLEMCFSHNFVHGDLHPGNILVSARTPDDSNGRPAATKVSFVDAGITSELSANDRRNFVALFAAIVQRDGRRAGRLMIDHARSDDCVDPDAFCEGIGRLVDSALGHHLRLESIQVSSLLAQAFALACKHRVKIESNFANVCIAIMVLEGVGRELDPSLDILQVAAPIVLRSFVREQLKH